MDTCILGRITLAHTTAVVRLCGNAQKKTARKMRAVKKWRWRGSNVKDRDFFVAVHSGYTEEPICTATPYKISDTKTGEDESIDKA